MASEKARMLGDDAVWDSQDRAEIIQHVMMNYESVVNYATEKAEIEEGCCHSLNNACQPWRWVDMETATQATHLALSADNVMYLKEKHATHVLNPCPPCLCCVSGSYREDFAPKIKKLIPFEKITDIEVHEAGSNELVTPGCQCPPVFNPISIEVPISKAFINTAGGNGPELIIDGIADANAFRRKVMELKKGGGAAPTPLAPSQQSMGAATIGASSEMVTLLRDIAGSNRQIVNLLQTK